MHKIYDIVHCINDCLYKNGVKYYDSPIFLLSGGRASFQNQTIRTIFMHFGIGLAGHFLSQKYGGQTNENEKNPNPADPYSCPGTFHRLRKG